MSFRGRALGERRGLTAPAMQEDTALGERPEPGPQEEKWGALLSFAHVPFKRSRETSTALCFLAFSGRYATLYPLHQLRERRSEEGGHLLLDAVDIVTRVRRKNRLQARCYSYFLMSRFIWDNQLFMMSHMHVSETHLLTFREVEQT